jgi:integrase
MGYTLRRPRGTKRWHCYFIDRKGARFRQSTKQTDKRRADVIASDWYRRFADPAYQAANETTIADASKHLKAALVQAAKSPETIKFYATKLSHVARIFGADTPMTHITAKSVDEYTATRKEEGASAYTVSKELTALRQLLKHARRRGEFDKELSQVMPIGFATGYKPRERRITLEQAWDLIHSLVRNGCESVARYVAFVCATTARDAAVGRARASHLVADGIKVFDRKTKASTRTVPVTRVTIAFASFAFEGLEGDAMVAPGVSSVRHALHRACATLKLPALSPNDLRRSVTHWHLEAGVPRYVAARFMGHTSTKMLDEVYGKIDPRELEAEMRRALGSTVDESWINEPKVADQADPVYDETAEKQCAGAESNRRHGDFQPSTTSQKSSADSQKTSTTVSDSWNDADAEPPSSLLTALRKAAAPVLLRPDCRGMHPPEWDDVAGHFVCGRCGQPLSLLSLGRAMPVLRAGGGA